MTTERSALKPMSRLANYPAEWMGHGFMKRSYELRAGDEVFATLRWESAFGSRAQAETADGAWTLKRVGFFHPRVTVRAPGSETDLAVFAPSWIGNGVVEFAAGPRWHWKCLGFWRSRYGFLDANDQPLIEYHANTLKLPPSAKLIVSPSAFALPEFPLLVVLGWYVTILTFDDMAGTGAAAAAAG